MNLMWFRADLRVADNPALCASMQAGSTVAVYTLCEAAWSEHRLSPAKISLICRQLDKLESDLAALHVPLIIIPCSSFKRVPGELKSFAAEHNISALYFNHEFEINERLLSKRVIAELQPHIHTWSFNDQCAIAPGKIKTGSDDWYKVFTPFKKRYLAEFSSMARAVYPTPKAQNKIPITSSLAPLQQVPFESSWQNLWPAGEDEAHRRLHRFVKDGMSRYHEDRDFPAVDGTSTLSPYLAVGAISTRQCMDAAIQQGGMENEQSTQGAQTWLSELVWRDFYRHLLYGYPDLCKFKAFQQNTERLPWRHDSKLLTAWQEGRTGFPIVDAAMKQLVQTGWMHNRLRMITAMFLTKHLFVDWRLGEDFFMQHLVDGDLASNNGGWQWSASTGVDAAPYFRIFNPTRQSERFDPNGEFIRHYLPELKNVSNKAIHAPSVIEAESCGYAKPIVDHSTAVKQTKTWFKELA